MESLLECGYCLGFLKDPIILNCSHNFCKDCLELMFEPENSIKCLECFQEMRSERSITESFPRNSVLSEFINEYRRENETQNIEIDLCRIHLGWLEYFCVEKYKLCCERCLLIGDENRQSLIPRQLALEQLSEKIELKKHEIKIKLDELFYEKDLKSKQLRLLSEILISEETLLIRGNEFQYEKSEEIVKRLLRTQKLLKEELVRILTLIERAEDRLEKTLALEDPLLFLQQARIPDDSIFKLTTNSFILLHKFLNEPLNTFFISLYEESYSPHKYFLYYIKRGSKEYFKYDIRTSSVSVKLEFEHNIMKWSGMDVLENGHLIITGGKTTQDGGAFRTAYIVNPETNEISTLPDMIYPHSSHVHLRAMHKVFCISGKDELNLTHNHGEFFDLNQWKWISIAPIHKTRTCASGAFLDNYLYVFGGYHSYVCSSIEQYSIREDYWEVLPTKLPIRIWQHRSEPISSTEIIIFGGEGSVEEPNYSSFVFNIEERKFYRKQSMRLEEFGIPTGTKWLSYWLPFTRADNEIFVCHRDYYLAKYNLDLRSWYFYKDYKRLFNF